VAVIVPGSGFTTTTETVVVPLAILTVPVLRTSVEEMKVEGTVTPATWSTEVLRKPLPSTSSE
jgi:hypothetical protein